MTFPEHMKGWEEDFECAYLDDDTIPLLPNILEKWEEDDAVRMRMCEQLIARTWTRRAM